MTTKQYLSRFQRINQEIDGNLAEIFRLKTMAMSITVAQKDVNVQSSGESDRMASAVAKIVDLEREIDEKIDGMKVSREKMISQIAQIDNDMEYTVLYQHYIQNLTFEKIAENSNYSIRHIFRVHGNALQSFEQKFGNLYLDK